jgi:WD40 repeat protein
MAKQKAPPKKEYLVYHYQLRAGGATDACPQTWWQKNAATYQLVAILRASTFQEARLLLVPQQRAWYRHAGVQLEIPSPVRETQTGDVVVSTNEYDPGIWMLRGDEWVPLEEPAQKAVYVGSAEAPVTHVACSPDGMWFANVDGYTLLRLETGRRPAPSLLYDRHRGSITALAWSPDGKVIASADGHGELHLWDFLGAYWKSSLRAEGERVLICQHRDQEGWSKITQLAWSPDGQVVATGNEHGVLRVWDVQSGRQQWEAHLHEGLPIDSLVYSPQGDYLVSSVGGKLHLWDTTAMMRAATFNVEVNDGERLALGFHPNAQEVLIGSSLRQTLLRCRLEVEATFSLSDVRQIPLSQFSRNQGILAIAFAPGGRYVAVGCADGTVQIYDLGKERLVHIYHAQKGGVLALAWSARGTRIISGGSDHRFRVWEPPQEVLSSLASQGCAAQIVKESLIEGTVHSAVPNHQQE